ncbi:hypothetical protein Aab01nite_69400 [Paractinoplanes abujensis]|uniref:Gram-positive cocci surface proteins LPxTG domain-containing protein n=1 Tax=Paractinoplanes abujensis TaxID=882441 RepID=A0A7W7CZA7_9ACTN|nr:hypothetical protein [Actinoplanes abujensis]MBB4695766.1 hypothetical protein [Actinoplanes abujensis]GID23350.1 hypothetical protein Aab01nite_69400 [Actinoplanes abujensis]
MTPARSLAASVVALGFASALTAPQPAAAAPTSCEQAENFAAQAGAEILRIDKLDVHAPAGPRPKAPERGRAESTAARVLSGDDSVIPDPADSDTLSEGIGLTATGALGYLGITPKPGPGGAGAVPPGRSGLAGDLAERGGAVVGGLTGGVGGGEPADSDSDGDSGSGTDKSGGSRTDGSGDGGSRGDGSRADKPRADDDSGADDDSVDTDDSQSDGEQVSDKRARATLSAATVGEARTAMIARSKVASAAYARMLGGSKDAALAEPLLQQAPPTHTKGATRSTPATKAGPFRLGDGRLGAHAQWDSGMACGRASGETGRADTSLQSLSVLGRGRSALVRVLGTMTSRGTTAIENHDDQARTVARSTITAGRIELAGGKVTVRVLRAPALEAAMSAADGGKVAYRPAVVEVSGEGLPTKRLEAAGDHVEFALTPNQRAMESAPVTELGRLCQAKPLPVPGVPGLPPVATPEPESAPLPAKGIRVRVSLGDVRHAIKGHAIAARAAAIKVSVSQAGDPQGSGHGSYGGRPKVALSMSLGVLEAAAVSPEGPAVSSGGGGGGLPVTGPRLDRIAMTGGGLLLAGIGVVLFGLRRRRPHS